MTEEEIAAFKKCKPGEAVEVTLPIVYMIRQSAQERFPMPEKTDAERLAEGWWESLKTMTDEQRLDVLSALKGHFCEHCGTVHLPCSCWNDE